MDLLIVPFHTLNLPHCYKSETYELAYAMDAQIWRLILFWVFGYSLNTVWALVNLQPLEHRYCVCCHNLTDITLNMLIFHLFIFSTNTDIILHKLTTYMVHVQITLKPYKCKKSQITLVIIYYIVNTNLDMIFI